MNSIRQTAAALFTDPPGIRKASILFFVFASSATSQVMVESNVATFESTQIRPATANGPLRRDLDRGQSAGLLDSPPLRWRSAELRPRLSYGYVHGDGILANPADLRTTDINTYTLGLALRQGSHWNADYVASRSIYSNSGFQDTSAHSASVAALTIYQSWDLKASHSYLSESLPNVETAQQTRQETHASVLIASISLNSRFSLKSVLNQDLRFPENYATSREWHVQEWLNYKLAYQLELSAGLHVGYVRIVKADDMQFDRPQFRFRWRSPSAFLVEAVAGIDHRTTRGSAPKPNSIFTYSALAKYSIFKTTFFSLAGARDITSSYFFHQAIINSTVTAALQQRILRTFYLSASIETQRAHYELLREPSLTPRTRDDKREVFELKLSTVIRNKLTLVVFLRRSKNNTNFEGYSFTSNQSGLEIAYTY
jgi:hypothetical protein